MPSPLEEPEGQYMPALTANQEKGGRSVQQSLEKGRGEAMWRRVAVGEEGGSRGRGWLLSNWEEGGSRERENRER